MEPRTHTGSAASGPRLRIPSPGEPLYGIYRVELRAPRGAPRPLHQWVILRARTAAAARHLARAVFPDLIVVSVTAEA